MTTSPKGKQRNRHPSLKGSLYSSSGLYYPLGLAVWRDKLLVADTYNNKIKTLDPVTKETRSFLGTGEERLRPDALTMWEPGGIDVQLPVAVDRGGGARATRAAAAEAPAAPAWVLGDAAPATARTRRKNRSERQENQKMRTREHYIGVA